MTNTREKIIIDGDFEEGEDQLPIIDNRNNYEKKMDDLFSSFKDKDIQSLKLSIYAQNPGGLNSGLALCEILPADKFSHDELLMYIREKYGPGDYRLQVRVKSHLRINELVTIAKALENSIKPSEGLSGNVIDRLMDRMDRQDARMQEFMHQSKSGGENSRMDMLREMMIMKELFGGGGNQGNGLKDMFAMISGLKEMGIEIGGSGQTEDTNFLGFLSGTMPLLEKIAGGAVDNQLNETRKKAEMFDELKKKASGAVNTVKEKMAPEMVDLVDSLKMLIKAAAKNKNVELYTELVLDQIPQKFIKPLYDSPDIVVLLSTIVPQFKPHLERYKDWFNALHEDLRQFIDDAQTESDLTAPADDVIESTASVDENNGGDSDNIHIDGDSGRGGGDEKNSNSDEGDSTRV